MALLTDQIYATGVSLNDLIHIVITGDTSQNPAGSSFKASIAQVVTLISGTTGTSGSSGTSGIDGTSGTDGVSGSSGTSGTDGVSGSSGTSGTDGVSGSSGTSGTDGVSGSSGTSGISGIDGALSGRWIFNTTYTPPTAPITLPYYFYTDSVVFANITEFVINSIGENSVDYSILLYKLSVSPGISVTITDVTDNSILGSWDIQTINYSPIDTRFVVSNTFAANGALNPLSSYSISFSINGANGSSGTSGSSGSSGSAGTSGTSPVSPYPFVYGLFSQTGNSPTVSATTVETSIIDGGVGTLSVPANGFSIGDAFNVIMGGQMSVKPGGDTLTLRVKSGSVILSDTGPLSIASVSNDVWQININFTIRNTGGTGTASIITLGNLHVIKTASATAYSFAFNTVNNTTFDTTVSNTLDITIQWGSNNAANAIYSDTFILNKIY